MPTHGAVKFVVHEAGKGVAARDKGRVLIRPTCEEEAEEETGLLRCGRREAVESHLQHVQAGHGRVLLEPCLWYDM
jgi:hypothetical protein